MIFFEIFIINCAILARVYSMIVKVCSISEAHGKFSVSVDEDAHAVLHN